MKRWAPAVAITAFVVYVAAAILRPTPSPGGFDVSGFGRLPVSLNGRVQPIDSAARLALLQISGTVTVPEDGSRGWRVWRRTAGLGATEWLLEVLVRPDVADTRRIFRISEPAVRAAALGAEPAAPASMHYSFKDLQPRVKKITDEVGRAAKVKPADRAAADREWLRLRDAVVVYERLKNSLQPNSFLQEAAAGQPVVYDFGARLASYEADMRAAITARRDGKTEGLDEATQERAVSFVRPYVGLSRAALISLLPPLDPERGRDRWLNTGTALVASSRTGTFPASLSFFAQMATAYANGNAEQFNRQLTSYGAWLRARGFTHELRRAGTESLYNRFQPFVRAVGIYLVVLVLAGGSIVSRSTMLYRSATMLLGLAAALHVIGILFDMMLQGTLPITTVYSGLMLSGAVGVALGAALEGKYRNRVGLNVAAVLGLSALVAAQAAAPGGAAALAAQVFTADFLLAAFVTLLALCLVLRPSRVALPWPVRAGVSPSE